MAALVAAVPPFAGGVPRRAATASSDASERASRKKRPRVGVASARDSSACLTKMTRGRNSVVTAAGEMSSQELLQKRLASELDALRGLLKKAELISRRGACKGGAPTAGKKDRSASKQRPKPIEEDFSAPSVKRRKISTLVEQKQKQQQQKCAPRMLQEERNQLGGRLSSLSGKVPGHIVEFLQKQFGDAGSHGEIEINIDSVEDSVLFELKTLLDKLLAEESKDDKHAGDSDQITGTSAQQPSEPASGTAKSTAHAESVSGGESTDEPAPMTIATNKIQDVKAVYMPGLLYRANLRRELLEMERARLPDQSIHPRDLQRLGITEYGHPRLMRQLGLVLKADDDK